MSDEAMREADLRAIVADVVADYPEQVEMYHKGGPMLGFLLGQVMKRLHDSGKHPEPMTTTAFEAQAALREILDAD